MGLWADTLHCACWVMWQYVCVYVYVSVCVCVLCIVVNKHVPLKPVKEDIRRFLSDADFTYEDFAQQSSGSGFATLRVQDYSWEEHGFSLANELYSEIAELLEDKFQTTQNLTYFTCVESSLHCVTDIVLFCDKNNSSVVTCVMFHKNRCH